MDDWVSRALQRWPNVPALFGWLGLDRRGRWLIQGGTITHPRIVETINRNYAADEHGRWFFQNGPQRGYMQLESTPLILFVAEDQTSLVTHTGQPVERITQACLDEEGALVLLTEHGPGELIGSDLSWALERMSAQRQPIDDETLAAALAMPSGSTTDITFSIASSALPLQRLNFADAPSVLKFERLPAPREGEKIATKATD
jgi:hypothetical protein